MYQPLNVKMSLETQLLTRAIVGVADSRYEKGAVC
jgi:hypothetical protein